MVARLPSDDHGIHPAFQRNAAFLENAGDLVRAFNKMPPREVFALSNYLGSELIGRTISDARHTVSLTNLLQRACLVGRSDELAARSVLLAVSDQLISAVAMIELDGRARRMLLCPPDADPHQMQALIEEADIDAIVTDQPSRWSKAGVYLVAAARMPMPAPARARARRATEWLLAKPEFSRTPKIAARTLEELCSAIVADAARHSAVPVWATFDDIRHEDGLRTFLRAIIGGGSLVLSESGEPMADFVARLQARGVTHVSGNVSQWRSLLMSGSAGGFSPSHVHLSGETADQALLDALRLAFPEALIGQACKVTGTGVGLPSIRASEAWHAN
jgi:hypothetical protein